MKQSIITLMTTVALTGTASWATAQEDRGTAPTERKPAIGTTEKIQQGVKNVFTELKFEDLPPAVQKTVREQSKNAKINDIDREDRTGRTIYEVEFEMEGNNREIHVAADGTLLTEEQASMQLGYDRDTDRTRVREKENNNMKFADLPAAVQATVKQHGQENQIADIDSYTRKGQRVYEVEFKQEGLNREIHVSEDGKLIDTDAPGRENGATEGLQRPNGERALPPSGAGTVPNPTLRPTDVK